MKANLREARAADAAELAALCGELGYPSTTAAVEARLGFLLGVPDHLLLVATDTRDRPVAWIHGVLERSLASDVTVDVGGLVVADGHRSGGTGGALLARIEDWAVRMGAGQVRVRSNVVRKRAHRFYQRAGYELVKTSRVFTKTVARPDGVPPGAGGPRR